jgi:phage shock protein E
MKTFARFLALTACMAAFGCDRKDNGDSATPATKESAASGLQDRDLALAKALIQNENAVVLDVRSASEFATGHIKGATLIPHDELPSRLAEVEALTKGDKNRAIVVYCRSGRRSGIAKSTLLNAGYHRVTNLGGFSTWDGEKE